MKLVNISRTKNEYVKAKLNLKLTARQRISGTYTGTSITLRRATSLELQRMRRVIWLDSHSNLTTRRNYFPQLLNYMGLTMLGKQKYTQQNQ